jgi:uncharacterized membrane protein
MDRTRANQSIRTGLVAAGIALLLFALTFWFAILFIGN